MRDTLLRRFRSACRTPSAHGAVYGLAGRIAARSAGRRRATSFSRRSSRPLPNRPILRLANLTELYFRRCGASAGPGGNIGNGGRHRRDVGETWLGGRRNYTPRRDTSRWVPGYSAGEISPRAIFAMMRYCANVILASGMHGFLGDACDWSHQYSNHSRLNGTMPVPSVALGASFSNFSRRLRNVL